MWPCHLGPPHHDQGSSSGWALLLRISEWAGVCQRCGSRLPLLPRLLAAMGNSFQLQGLWVQSQDLAASWSPGGRRKLAIPSPGLCFLPDLDASHSVTQRSPQTDSSLLPPSAVKGGKHYNKNNDNDNNDHEYLLHVSYVLDHILAQRTLQASLPLTLCTAGYNRVCVISAFHR